MTIPFKDGVAVRDDGPIKAGDLITAYRKGFHRIVEVIDRGKHTAPAIKYKPVADAFGRLSRGKKEYLCDASFCRKVTVEYLNDIIETDRKQFEVKKSNLLRLSNMVPVPE